MDSSDVTIISAFMTINYTPNLVFESCLKISAQIISNMQIIPKF